MNHYQSLIGIAVFIGLAALASEQRRDIAWSKVVLGLLLQVGLGVLLLEVAFFKTFFLGLTKGVRALEEATVAGTSFVFGFLGGGNHRQ